MSYSKFQSRKFILAMLVVILAAAGRATNYIDIQAWVTVTMAVVGAYLTANVWQNVSDASNKG